VYANQLHYIQRNFHFLFKNLILNYIGNTLQNIPTKHGSTSNLEVETPRTRFIV